MAEKTKKSGDVKATPTPGGDAVYAHGITGAWVYYWQRADTSGERTLAILKRNGVASVHLLTRPSPP